MFLHTQIEIDAPASKAWHVLGERFESIDEWAVAVSTSTLEGDLGVGARRTCESPSFGPFAAGRFTEEITHFDSDAMTFTYTGVEGNPWFMTQAHNAWSVETLGSERCCIHSRADITLLWWVRPLGPILTWLMRGAMGNFKEELRYRIEEGHPHPRKSAARPHKVLQ